ncbi:MAG: serine hydrolase [Candidatus Kapabacteria bacterium]|nr:serine hydrolase [Candidatus Kapabacteria bacterium]
MKIYITFFCLIVAIFSNIKAQDLYFPPIVIGQPWETLNPEDLGWNMEKIPQLYDYLDEKNSKAFILIKDGKIVLEKYFGNFTQDSNWYWASAGKTLTATLTGLAQEEGILNINDKTSKYLGEGWTSFGSANQIDYVDCVDSNSNCSVVEIEGDEPYKLPNGNPSPFSAFADPCIRKDPNSDTLWMAYSWPNFKIKNQLVTPAVDIHLAYSLDSGNKWHFKKKLFESQEMQNPENSNQNGSYDHETINFVPYQIADEIRWAGARLNYFIPEGKGFGERPYTSLHITLFDSKRIEDFNEENSIKLGGNISKNEWGIDLYLPSIIPDFPSNYQFWNEPALYFENGMLYLVLVSFAFDNQSKPDLSKSNVYVFSTVPNGDIKEWIWKYNGELIDSELSSELGGESVTQTEISTTQDGKLILLCTPKIWNENINDFTHKGCKIIEIDNLDNPELSRYEDGELKVLAEINASDAGPSGTAAAAYDPNLAKGVIFGKREKGENLIIRAMIWNTGLHPSSSLSSPGKEDLITIRHQLTMTTGLDYDVENSDCTDPECLKYKADAGSQWYYHNAPYTLLERVIEEASGDNYNQYFFRKLRNKIGMNGLWLKIGFNNVYFSTPRSMARFGLLMLGSGNWGETEIISDKQYLSDMISTSNDFNKSYGYLWWLNGKESFMIPGTTKVFSGSAMPDAPDDVYSALGKDGQILNVSPSKGLILVRMGERPDDQFFISTIFNNEIWKYVNEIMDGETSVADERQFIGISPNPASGYITIQTSEVSKTSEVYKVQIFDILGIELMSETIHPMTASHRMNIERLPKGMYFIKIGDYLDKFIVVE